MDESVESSIGALGKWVQGVSAPPPANMVPLGLHAAPVTTGMPEHCPGAIHRSHKYLQHFISVLHPLAVCFGGISHPPQSLTFWVYMSGLPVCPGIYHMCHMMCEISRGSDVYSFGYPSVSSGVPMCSTTGIRTEIQGYLNACATFMLDISQLCQTIWDTSGHEVST